MLRSLVESSLRFRGAFLGIACLLLAYGVWVTLHAKLDVFPEFAPPQVFVHTEAPGFTAEEVETLVTRPVEAALNGVGDLERLQSQSIQGVSVVWAVFREGTDILRARQLVSERLVELPGELPQGVGAPALAPLTSSTSFVLGIGLTSEERTPEELRTLADWTVRPRLLAVPGVASIIEFGGDIRQLQIRPDPDLLAARGLTLAEIREAARRATGVLGTGFVEDLNQRIPIRVEGQSVTPEELGKSVLRADESGVLRLRDVAVVGEGPAPRIGAAAVNGVPGVLLHVWSQYGTNTLEVTSAVESALEEIRPVLKAEGVELHPKLFRPATFIEQSIRNITISLLAGGLLVMAILGIFLVNLRSAFISLTAIPLSLISAVIILDLFGVTLNTLTLGGLAIAIGEVVDDAIIDVENVFRRLRENRASAAPKSSYRVVWEASLEVRGAVVYATFIVALVFLPVVTMSGVQGRLFAPLGIAYILATLASLLVALTVTPALCLVLLAGKSLPDEPRHLRWLKGVHLGWLRPFLAHPRIVAVAMIALCGGAAAMLPLFGGEFLPEFQEGHFIVQMSTAPGTSLDESQRLGRRVSRELLKHPLVRSVSVQSGRAEMGEDTAGPEFSELIVALRPVEDEEAGEMVRADLRRILAGFPGAKFAVLPFLEERIEETISGVRAEVAVRIYGDDLSAIERTAGGVQKVLSSMRGAVDVRFEESLSPQLQVRLLKDRLLEFGAMPVDVLETVRTAFQGEPVSESFRKNQVTEVVVILDKEERRRPEGVSSLLVPGRGGDPVPLGLLADIQLIDGRHVIRHEGARRYQEVTCNVQGRDVASFVSEAKRRVADEVSFPRATYPVFSGAAEAREKATREILLHSLLAGAGILVLLGMVFRRMRSLLLVLTNLPFALVGGVLAVLLLGGALSLGTLVGFVTLFGISLRNSIMLISHYQHLVSAEGKDWSAETALKGAGDRVAPILMTALTTGLGLLPLAISTGGAGHEIEGPMAIVILGGLATSTLLNLFALPALALRFGRFEREEPEPSEIGGGGRIRTAE